MVAQGEADLAPSISAVDATNPETDVSYLNSETLYLRIDSAVDPISDKRVREALNLAIDREAFIGTLLPEGTEVAVAMVPPTTLGWNPDVKPFPYDPEKATALLEEAKADGVPVDTPIQLIGRSNLFPGVVEVVEAMQQMLQDVGFTVEVQMLEVAQIEELYNKPFKEGRPPQMLAVQHDNSRGDPVFSMFFKYASEGRQSGIADPKVDELIAKATAATGDERAAALAGAHRLRARRGDRRRAALPHGQLRPRRRPDRVHADDRDELAARAGGHRLQVTPSRERARVPAPQPVVSRQKISAAKALAIEMNGRGTPFGLGVQGGSPCPDTPRESCRASSRSCSCSSWSSSCRG